VQYLQRPDRAEELRRAAGSKRWFIVADEMARSSASIEGLVDELLALNSGSRALFLASEMPSALSIEAEFRFPSQFLLYREAPILRATEIQIARYAPSFSLLRQFHREPAILDQLSWREFEKLIAGLLERDGYTVELMQGSKDGGVDIVASKDLGPHGYFKALWQAKKKAVGTKVGISVVRELADTRDQFGASQGVIVTSSYLTKGAIERIDRDKFILGKVDRRDLNAWIQRTLLQRDG
jgi:restriction system protein